MRTIILAAILFTAVGCNTQPAGPTAADLAAQAKSQRCAELSRQLEAALSASQGVRRPAVVEAEQRYDAECKR